MLTIVMSVKKKKTQQTQQLALARWLGWLEHRPMYQEVAGAIPGQGTCLGRGFDP